MPKEVLTLRKVRVTDHNIGFDSRSPSPRRHSCVGRHRGRYPQVGGCYPRLMTTFRSLANDEEYAQTQADFVAAIHGAATEARDQVVGVPPGLTG